MVSIRFWGHRHHMVVMLLGWFVDRFFGWFFDDFGVENQWKIDKKSARKVIDDSIDVELDFGRLLDWFWMDFGRVLGAKMAPKSFKNRPKIHSKWHQIYEWFSDRSWRSFLMILHRFSFKTKPGEPQKT